MKRFFVAATRQNEGKTTVALGLMASLIQKFKRVGFIKPVGQRYVHTQGFKVDEDSILMWNAFNLNCAIKDTSPVAIGRRFTREFIAGKTGHELEEEIMAAFNRVSENQEIVVIEGTGHAGVGSVMEISNADVSRLLGSKVVIVTGAGIGRAVDEVMLNQCLFKNRGVEILGVILNKARPEKIEEVSHFVSMALEERSLKLLGVIPYVPELSRPTVGQILEELKCELLFGEDYLTNPVGKIVVGAMSPHRALTYITDNALCITPGERDDIILAAMSSSLVNKSPQKNVSGLLLTGGMKPHESIMRIIEKAPIPTLLIDDDSFHAAAKVHDVTVKIRPTDTEKISLARKLIQNNVNVNYILENI